MKRKKTQPRPVAHRATQDTVGEHGWQPSDVQRVVSNPLYVGLGPLPPLMPTADWVRTASKVVEEVGLNRFLILMIENLQEAFKDVTSFEGNFKPPFGYKKS